MSHIAQPNTPAIATAASVANIEGAAGDVTFFSTSGPTTRRPTSLEVTALAMCSDLKSTFDITAPQCPTIRTILESTVT